MLMQKIGWIVGTVRVTGGGGWGVGWHQEAIVVIQVGQAGMNWALQDAPWSESVQWPAGCNSHRDP